MSTQTLPEAEHAQGESFVAITINGVNKEIHRGRQTVAAIKTLGNVLPADELDQVIDGKLVPLANDGAVTIKGGEVFLSRPPDSGSSNGEH